MMLFTDDTVLAADLQSNLQKLLDILDDYLDRIKLELNLDETIVLIFRKCGRLEKDVKLSFEGRRVKLVEEWSYLAVKFKTKGNLFSSHIESRIEKGKACCNMVLRIQLRDIKKIQVVKEVFRVKISGMMHYGSEVWEHAKGDRLEAV